MGLLGTSWQALPCRSSRATCVDTALGRCLLFGFDYCWRSLVCSKSNPDVVYKENLTTVADSHIELWTDQQPLTPDYQHPNGSVLDFGSPRAPSVLSDTSRGMWSGRRWSGVSIWMLTTSWMKCVTDRTLPLPLANSGTDRTRDISPKRARFNSIALLQFRTENLNQTWTQSPELVPQLWRNNCRGKLPPSLWLGHRRLREGDRAGSKVSTRPVGPLPPPPTFPGVTHAAGTGLSAHSLL